ncbi:hypothetical protein [Arthrobacter mobilis]|uniref:Lipoprotein n=1 Tax=Arthrobacter mobilis TaxID=2724944 RepID=A0A7X6K764_9MICC|nr:hypothetical protein [Arthrobacter mobilis]NKX56407.1 hypothetical protein [Arthrobacter mobilis]
MGMRPGALRRTAAALAASAALLFLTGCQETGQETGTEETEAIANGVDADVGPVQVRSLLVVSTGDSQPGRLLGTLSNTADAPAEVVISDNNEEVAVTVDGGSDYGFDTRPTQLDSISGIPGALVPVKITVGSDSQELQVPVMDGTLEPYRPYLPTGDASPPAETPTPAPSR